MLNWVSLNLYFPWGQGRPKVVPVVYAGVFPIQFTLTVSEWMVFVGLAVTWLLMDVNASQRNECRIVN